MIKSDKKNNNSLIKIIRIIFFFLFAFSFLFFSVAQAHADNIEAILDSTNGSSVFSVQDSTPAEVFHVDSDGNVVATGCIRVDGGGLECAVTEGLVVDGNIGIGTSTPAGKLAVEGGDAFFGTGTLTNASGSEDVSVTGNLEVDGTIYGSGIGLVGVVAGSVSYTNITAATANSGIGFGGFTNVWTSTMDAGTVFKIDNTDADLSSDTVLLDLEYTDDGDVNAIFLQAHDNNGDLKFQLGAEGAVDMFASDGDTGRIAYTTDDAFHFSGGNVGVGTASPSGLLDVEGGDVFLGTAALVNASASEDLSITGNLEVDGTIYGTGVGLVGVVAGSVAYDDITAPDRDSGINFAGFTNVWTSTLDTGVVFQIDNTDADLDADTVLLRLEYTDDGDANAIFLQARDNNADLKFQLGAEGTVDMFASDGDTGRIAYTTDDAFHFSGGNFGIGTASPSGLLDIEGGDTFFGTGTLTNATVNEDVSITGNLEVDGTLYGNGSGISGVTASGVAYDDITAPDRNSAINFAAFTNVWTSTLNGGTAFQVDNTTADLTSSTVLLRLEYTDDGDVDGVFFQAADNNGDLKFQIGQDGSTLIYGDGVIGASTSTTETLANAGFALGGDDLFVAGTAGVEGNIYTDGNITFGSGLVVATSSLTQPTGSSLSVALGGAAGDDLLVDTNTLVVESDNNQVGIGTATPSGKLDVEGGDSFFGTGTLTNTSVNEDVSVTGNLEVDGTFYGSGAGLTGVAASSIVYNNILSPTANAGINFLGFTNVWTSALDTGVVFRLNNTDADLAADTVLLDLQYTDDGDANAIFLQAHDNNGDLKFQLGVEGDTLIGTGTLTNDSAGGDLSVAGNTEVDANVVVGASTSAAETLANAGFALGGDDLFVAGTAGVEGNIYTDGNITFGSGLVVATSSLTQPTGSSLSVALGGAAGDDLLVDTNTLVVESDNNQVGIGTATPSGKLDVEGGDSFFGTGTLTNTSVNEDVSITGNLEVDGTFYGSGAGLTGVSASSIVYNNILSPTTDAGINFLGFTNVWTSTLDTGVVFKIDNTDADLAADTVLMELEFTDDGDANGIFLRARDNNADLKFEVGADGSTTIYGNNIVGASTSTTETIAAAGFSLGGDDLFVAGTAGVEGNIYTDGSLDINNSAVTLTSNSLTRATGAALNVTLGGAAGDDLLVDTNTLVVESDNNQVGIGTATPSGKLDVEGGDIFFGTGTLTNTSVNEDVSVTGNLEVDGTIYGSGAGLTGVSASSVAYDDITAPDRNSAINFAGFTNIWTSTMDTGAVFKIDNTDADLAADTVLLDLEYTDDGDANAIFMQAHDNNGDLKFQLGAEGTVDMFASDGDTGRIAYTTDDAFHFSGGNFGIGTASPSGLLDIEGGDTFFGTGTLTNTSVNEDVSITGNLEVDGTFYGNGTGLTGVVASSMAYSSILSPTTNHGINFLGFTNIWTSTLDTGVVFQIDNTDADLAADTVLLRLEYTDDGDANAIFVQARDNDADLMFQVGADGDTLIGSGTLTNMSAAGDLSVTGNAEVDANVVVGASTSAAETIAAAGFSMGGDDLFVAGMAGVEGNIYTDGTLDINNSAVTLTSNSLTRATGSSLSVSLGGAAGDDLLVDTNTLVVESDNNQVGIGTATPSGKLDVEGGDSFFGTGTLTNTSVNEDVSVTGNLEVDGTFYGSGAGLTGVAASTIVYNNILSPTTDAGINFLGFTNVWTSTLDTGVVFKIDNTDADLAADTVLMELEFTDDGDTNGIFLRARDNNADLKFEIGADGSTTIYGNNIVGASTSATETIAAAGFSMGGDDLFVAGMAGVEGNIYTDGSLDINNSAVTLTSNSLTRATGAALNVTLGGAAGDDLLVDTNTLVVESDNNQVGIGTATPSGKLDVEGGDIFFGTGTLTNTSVNEDVSITGNLEVDGTIYGSGAGLTGVSASSVAYDDITAPDRNSAINFAGFTNIWTSTMDTGSVFKIDNTDADLAADTVLLDLEYTDDGDANAIFMQAHDNNGDLKFQLGAEGTVDMFASDGDTGRIAYTTDDAFHFSGGNFGIGTASPSGLLDIEGGDTFFGTGTLTNTSVNEDVSVTGNLEVDGTIYGNGAGLTGVSASNIIYNNILSPTTDAGINFLGFTNVWTSTLDTGVVFKIDNTDADLAADTVLMELEFTDDGDANGIFLRARDNNADLKFEVGADGSTTIYGNNIVGASTSTTETIAAAGFSLGGDDLFVAGTAGVEGNIYTDGSLDINNSAVTLTSNSLTRATGSSLSVSLGGAAGDDLLVDTNTLVVESDNNQVGIGTATPSGKLDVEGGDIFFGTGTLTNTSVNEDVSVTGNLEVDGTIYGSGAGLTGVAASTIVYNNILSPTTNAGIDFLGFTNVWTSALNGGSVFKVDNTTADLTTSTVLLDLEYTDDGDADGLFIQAKDNNGDVKLQVGVEGDTLIGSGTLTNATAAGDLSVSGNLEVDGTIFGIGSGITGVTATGVPYSGITAPTVNHGINFAGFTNIWTSTLDTGTVFKIDNTDADLAADTVLLDLEYTDDGDANAIFMQAHDNNGDLKFQLGAEGTVDMFASDGDTGRIAYTTDDAFHFSGGNFGIGTASPSGLLDIEGGDTFFGTGTLTNTSVNEDVSVTGNLEVDGTIYGNGAGLTGVSASNIIYNNILSPTTDAGINFLGFTNVWTSALDTGVVFKIDNTDADLAADTVLMELEFTDDGDANGIFLRARDNNADLKFEIGADGSTTIYGNNIVGASTSTTETIAAAGFSLGGDDLFVAGTAGVEGNIYTDGSLDINNSAVTLTSNSLTRATGSSLSVSLGGAAGDDLLVDTNTLVVESDNNQVGIGTATPSGKLDVEGGDIFFGTGTLTNTSVNEDVSVTGNLEVDGTIYGNGAGITGVSASNVAYSSITAPTVNSAINFAGFTNIWTSTMDTGAVFKIDNTDADLAADTVLLDLEYTDDGDANAIFMQAHDNNGDLKFQLGAEGTVDMFASDGDTGRIAYTTDDAFHFSGGNFGIGTASPSGLLDIEGGDTFFGTGTLTNTSVNEDVSITGNLEVDGTIYGIGTGITGVTASSVAYSSITAPTVNSAINFAAFTNIWTSTMNGGSAFKVDNTTADLTSSTVLLDLEYTDDGDTDGLFIQAKDNNGDVKLQVGVEGDTLIGSGTLANGSAAGDLSVSGNLEVDGTIYGNGSGLTSVAADSMPYNRILSPTTNWGINFAGFTNIWTSTLDTGIVFKIRDTEADLDGDTVLLDLELTDDGDANGIFLQAHDNVGDLKFQVGVEGDTLIGSGTLTNATAAGDLSVSGNLEVDGTIYGNGAGITGVSASNISYSGITAPTANHALNFAAFTNIWTSTLDTGSVFKIDNTDADLTADTVLLDLEYTDDGDANAIFLQAKDNNGDVKLQVGVEGDTLIGSGTLTNGSAAGDLSVSGNLEVDGTIFGIGSGITGVTAAGVPYSGISAPTVNHAIDFAGFTNIWTSTLDTGVVFQIDNTDADLAADTVLLRLEYTDDGDANAIFMQARDNNADLMFQIGSDGDTLIGTGTLTNGSAAGDLSVSGNLEVDGTIFGNGSGLTGVSASGVPYSGITAPTVNSAINFAAFTNIWTSTMNGGSAFKIDNTTADLTSSTVLLDLEYTDDADTDGLFIQAKDNNGDVKLQVGVEGDTLIGSGTLTNGSAAGDLSVSGNLEVDGTIFGNGAGITGVTASGVPYSGITAPTVNHGIDFASFTNVWTSTLDTGIVFRINNTDADLSADTVLLDLQYTDDGDANAIFFQAHDNNGDLKFQIGGEGALTMVAPDASTGTLSYVNGDAFSFSGGNVGIGTTAPNARLETNGTVAYTPSSTANITAGGGVSVTNGIMRIQGSGGAVDITVNPQVAAGTADGQVVIIKGQSDANTVKFDDGTGLQLSSGVSFTVGLGDVLVLMYDSTDGLWIEMKRSDN